MASKKDFTADLNPALSFITARHVDTTDEPVQPEQESGSVSKTPIELPPVVEKSTISEVDTAPTKQISRYGPKVIDPKGEKRSRRVQLLVRPSLYEKVMVRIKEDNISFSSLMDDLLSLYVHEKKN